MVARTGDLFDSSHLLFVLYYYPGYPMIRKLLMLHVLRGPSLNITESGITPFSKSCSWGLSLNAFLADMYIVCPLS